MAKFKDWARRRFDPLSPKARQWLTLGGLAGVCFGCLWLVFASSSSTRPAPAPDAVAANSKPTNLDVMTPGSQVTDAEAWAGGAGRRVAALEAENDRLKEKDRRRDEAEERLTKRLAELETKFGNSPSTSPAPAPAPAPVPPAPAPAAQPAPAAPAQTSPGVYPPGSPGAPVGGPGGALPTASAPPEPLVPPVVKVSVGRGLDAADSAAAAASAAPAASAPQNNLSNFLPVSFTRGHLLSGLDAPTGGQAQSNPHPILIRLSDNSVLPNRFRGEYRECFVIAGGYGEISSERAMVRTASLSCVRDDGGVLEVKIEGNVMGEDGKYGIRGRLVTKQGQMLANALRAGIVGGIGQGFASANTTYSTSALGAVGTTSGSQALRAGVGSGIGRAMERLADYYIRLAENTFPVIEVDAGREVDVVITKGVRIDAPPVRAKPTSTRATANEEPIDRYTRMASDEEE